MKKTKLSAMRNISLLGSFLVFALVGLFAAKDKHDDGSRQSHDIFTVANADYVGSGSTGSTGGGSSTGSTSSDSCTGPGTDAGGSTGNASSADGTL